MPSKKLKEFLDSHEIKYISISHSPAYTAQEIAGAAHIPGRCMAKTVMVTVGDKMAMVVLPAECRVDFDLLKEVTGAEKVELAGEQEFMELFPDCDVGAMPPFGNLYGLEVYAEESLARNDEIAFNAGTHSEIIQLAYRDFDKLVKPEVLNFAYYVSV
ncbi:MAG: aminoacyl-tRNA deacylase [Nitrospinaceae bacterium]